MCKNCGKSHGLEKCMTKGSFGPIDGGGAVSGDNPMDKAEESSENSKESPEKELEDLDKNMPKMGGKDPMSRMMTTHAMGDAAKKAPIQSQSAAAIANSKLPSLPSPAQHAQRAETFSDFMPKGKFSKNELIKEMESMDKWTPKA